MQNGKYRIMYQRSYPAGVSDLVVKLVPANGGTPEPIQHSPFAVTITVRYLAIPLLAYPFHVCIAEHENG